MEITWTFDATQHDPTQIMPAHPVGKFLATISGTDIKPTKDNNGGFLEVMFTTEAGSIPARYNLWNQSQQAADIAHRQLAALCYVTGIFKLGGKAEMLRGARCGIEVTKQKNGDYTEVAAVMDINGNLPTKQPSPVASQQTFQPQPQPATAPVAANPWSKPTVAADPPGAASPPQQGFQQQPNGAGPAAAPPWATR